MADDAHGKTTIMPELRGSDAPAIAFGKTYPSYWYTDVLVQYPTLFCALYGFVPFLLAVLSLTFTPTLDTNEDALSIRDHWSAQHAITVQTARDEWVANVQAYKTNQRAASRSTSSRSSIERRLYLTYEVVPERLLQFAPSGVESARLENLLESENLAFMHDVEGWFHRHVDYLRMCWRAPFRGAEGDTAFVDYDIPACTPLNSVLTYFYAGALQNVSGYPYWEFNGFTGQQQRPLNKMIPIVFQNQRIGWFGDHSADIDNPKTSVLRTQIQLGTPLATTTGRTYDADLQESLYADFTDQFIDFAEAQRDVHPYIRVGFGGDDVAQRLLIRAINGDAQLVIPSVFLILLILWFHFHSFLLAAIAVCQIAATYPSGYVLYMATSGRELSLLSALNVFVILVIATNSMMIFFDTFKQSGYMPTTGRRNLLSISQRVAYTFRKAGVGITIANLVAAACFGITSTSKVPAVSSFAVLMTCLIAVNWLLLLTFFPAAILFHHFHISGRRRNLQRQKEILLARGLRRREPNMVLFLQEEAELRGKHHQPSWKEMDEFMRGELEHETMTKEGGGGLWTALGIQAPIRVRNPFARTVRPGEDDPAPQEDAEAVDAQVFLDQFQDANAVTSPKEGDGEGGADGEPARRRIGPKDDFAPVQFNHRNMPVDASFRIRNINNDELLGFDDSQVRFRLMEMGAQAPAELTAEQLSSIQPLLGVEPQGDRAAARAATITRHSVFLMYVNGRSTHRPANPGGAAPQPTQDPNAAGAAAVASGNAAAAQQQGHDGQAAQPQNSRFGFSKRISDWWAHRRSVERKWCCGLVGERVGETQEEREARIMAKRIKHEGYSRAELLFFNKWAPAVNFARFPLILIMVAWIVVAIIFAASLEPASKRPQLIGSSPVQDYEEMLPRFAQSGTCDTCSAYFQPITTFPRPNLQAVFTCATNRYGGDMITASLDQCGVCHGNNSCYDCRGIANGPHRLDTCGQCLVPGDTRFDECLSCSVVGNIDSSMECGICPIRRDTATNVAGANCAVRCDATNCHPLGGQCNPVTGECRCFNDDIRGYWVDNVASGLRCGMCNGLVSGPNCNVECNNPAVQPCNCDVNRGICTGCIAEVLGEACQNMNPGTCNPQHGFVSGFGCSCNSGWDPMLGCNYETRCNGRGLTYTAAQLPPGAEPGCRCLGQWRGPSCQYCKCYNGGACTQNGTCICVGGFSGRDCQECPSTCVLRGSCPFPLPADLYPTRTCRAIFCNDTELYSGVALSASCRRCDASGASPTCGAFTTESNCHQLSGCDWDAFTGTCRRSGYSDPLNPQPLPSNYTECPCNGRWSGQFCQTCDTGSVPGTHCEERTGRLLGCDGQGADSRGVFKVVDSCGTCGGSTACTGCDGIPGSTKTLDLCGVCGGFNECAAGAAANGGTIVKTTSEVRVMFGLNPDGTDNPEFNFADSRFQSHLHWICLELNRRADLTRTEQTRCIMENFVEWLRTTRSIAFPLPNEQVPEAHRLMFEYVSQNGRFDEVGFTQPDPTFPNFRVRWVLAYVRTANIFDDTPEAEQQKHIDLWHRIMANINNPATRGQQGEAIMASDAWRRTYTQRASKHGATFILVVASIAFLGIVASITCSPTLVCICGATMLSHILSVLGIFRMLGWELGPIELIALALLLGLAGEQQLHMSEAYLEYLHAAQSSMFARETTRLQAVKGMYQRTGVSSFLSGITILLCSAFFFAAKVLVIRRIAGVMFVLIITNIVHALIFMGALLCVVGPTVSYRNRRTALLFTVIACLAFAVIFCAVYFTKAIRLL